MVLSVSVRFCLFLFVSDSFRLFLSFLLFLVLLLRDRNMLQAHKHCSPESFCLTGRFFTYNFVVVMAATISTSTLGLSGTLEKTSSRASLKSSTLLKVLVEFPKNMPL